MTGMTNRPEHVEDENQQRVEAQKDRLPDFEQVNRPRQDHPMDRDQEAPAEEAGERRPRARAFIGSQRVTGDAGAKHLGTRIARERSEWVCGRA